MPARVFIGNLPSDTSFQDLFNICSPYGQVEVIELQEGTAFIDFADSGHSEQLIQAYNGERRAAVSLKLPGKDFHSKTLNVQRARAALELHSVIDCKFLDSWEDGRARARNSGRLYRCKRPPFARIGWDHC